MARLRLAPRRIALLVSFFGALGAGAVVGTAGGAPPPIFTIPTFTIPGPIFRFCLSADARGNSCAIGSSGEATKDVTSYTNPVSAPFDPANPGLAGCWAGGVPLRTAWYQMSGTGHRIHLTTANSNYDTIVAVFPHGTSNTPVAGACDDDGGPGFTSNVDFTSTSGTAYDVMVGEYSASACPGTTPACSLVLGRNPINDDRADATTLAPTDTSAVDASGINTKYADTETGEHLSCTPTGGSPQTIGQTVWYKITTTSSGVLDLFASGFSSVLGVYPHGASTTALGCNAGSSDDLKVHVGPGTYDVQLGGNGATTFTTSALLHTDFTSDSDQDKDGFTSKAAGGADCNDHSPTIHPGATDIPNDGIDQNCDGHDAKDADHDGIDAPPDGKDCNDHSAAIHPGAKDIPADKIDQNCDGKDAKFPVLGSEVSISFLFFSHFTKLTTLNIAKAKAGSTVKLTCKGHGCSKSKTVKVKKSTSKLKLGKLVNKSHFAKNAKLKVQVTAPGQIGTVVTFKFRIGKAPTRSTQCFMPNAKKPQKHC